MVDNWRATQKLTVNLGLRYELLTVPYTVNGCAVIRAGYGIYYNPNQTNTFTFLSNNPPFSANTTCTASASINFSHPTPASACGIASRFNIVSPNPNLPTPYMNQLSFDAQQTFWNSAALDVQYLGSESTHLDHNYYNNTPLPNSSRSSVNSLRPNQLFQDICTIQDDVISSYNGLSITLRQRLSHGATALASYTWSHTLDVSTDSNGGGAGITPTQTGMCGTVLWGALITHSLFWRTPPVVLSRQRRNFQFRSEFFNLLDTSALSNPNTTYTGTPGSNFGTISSTKHDNREIQFALKLQF